jgi:cyclase
MKRLMLVLALVLTIAPAVMAQPPEIMVAIQRGDLERVKALVEGDPQLVILSIRPGGTPLLVAVGARQLPIVEYLISKGADVNYESKYGGRPLDVADELGDAAIVRALEAKGARFTPLTFEVTTVTPDIHRIAFPWGMRNNVVAFSGRDGVLLVDSGFVKRAAPELKKTIAGFSKGEIRYVIDTHLHGDHTAGNALAPSPAAVISAQTLGSSVNELRPEGIPLKGRTGRLLPAPYLMRFNGDELKLIPRGGLHSADDLIVYFPKSHVVAMGDLLLSQSLPAATDVAAYMAFLEDVIDVFPDGTTFISGHGKDLTYAGLKKYRDALVAMTDVVRKSYAAGKSADDMVRDDVLKAYKEEYSLLDWIGPDSWIPRVVRAIQAGALK